MYPLVIINWHTDFLQQTRSHSESNNEYILVTCSNYRQLNENPPKPEDTNYSEHVARMYRTPHVEVWILLHATSPNFFYKYNIQLLDILLM